MRCQHGKAQLLQIIYHLYSSVLDRSRNSVYCKTKCSILLTILWQSCSDFILCRVYVTCSPAALSPKSHQSLDQHLGTHTGKEGVDEKIVMIELFTAHKQTDNLFDQLVVDGWWAVLETQPMVYFMGIQKSPLHTSIIKDSNMRVGVFWTVCGSETVTKIDLILSDWHYQSVAFAWIVGARCQRKMSYCSLGSDVSAAHNFGTCQWFLTLRPLPEWDECWHVWKQENIKTGEWERQRHRWSSHNWILLLWAANK